MTARWLAAWAMLCVSLSRTLSAQDAILRGTVHNTTGQPLVYAVVNVAPLNLQQFSNNDGKFFFINLRPGKYVVTVRQLGYSPITREITLAPGSANDLPIVMTRIVTKLATMDVKGEWACNQPGRPAKGAGADLLEVFEQLEQNAVRLRLLSKAFPSTVVTERRRSRIRADGTEQLDGVDSLRTDTPPNAQYKAGRVIQVVRAGPGSRELYMQVPTLLDFADAEFQKHHCFVLRGVDESVAHPRIRVDFQASAKLKAPDIEGSVFLEPGTFRLLSSEIRLTKIPRELGGLMGVQATTHFRDVVPGLPMTSELIAKSELKPLPPPNEYVFSMEYQKTLTVHFVKARPAGLPNETTNSSRH